MPAEGVYRCRVLPCQAIKAEGNHWFVVRAITLGKRKPKKKKLVIEEFSKAAADRAGAQEICSESCLHKFLSRWASRVPTMPAAQAQEATQTQQRKEKEVNATETT